MMCIILTLGGTGGFYACNKAYKENPELRLAVSIKGGAESKRLKAGVHNPKYNDKRREWNQKAQKTAKLTGVAVYNSDIRQKGTQAALTPEAREKRIKTLKEINHQHGEKNSQYGTMWIYNSTTRENKKISKEQDIPEGWMKGRITKK